MSVPDWVYAYNGSGGKFLLEWVVGHGRPHVRAKCRLCGWYTGPTATGRIICVGCGAKDQTEVRQ